MASNKTNQTKSKSHTLSKSESELIKQLYSLVLQYSKTTMSGFFNNVDTFFNDESKIASFKNLSPKLAAQQLKLIQTHKLDILASFLTTIKKSFSQFAKNEFNYFDDKVIKVIVNQNKPNKLIDKDDINEKQLQNSLNHKYEKAQIKNLFVFRQKLALISKQPLDSYKIPFGPFVFVSAFAKSIRLLHLKYPTKQALYEVFDTSVLENIGSLYDDIKKSLSTKIVDKSTFKNKAPEKSKEDNHIKTSELINALDIVKNNLSLADAFAIKSALLKQLNKQAKNSEACVCEQDKDKIDLTTLVFQLAHYDVSIPNEVKSVITKFQVPYMKASLLGDNIFAQEGHPARDFIILVSHYASRWQKENDQQNGFITQLQNTYNVFIDEEQFENGFFDKQVLNFKEYIKNNEHFDISESLDGKLQGQNKIKAAMKTVDALLNNVIDNKPTPDFVKNILLGSWKNLLVLMFVRHANTVNNCLPTIRFMDSLYNILKPEQYEFILNDKITFLSNDYARGLELIAYGKTEIDKKIDTLKANILKYHETKHTLKKDVPCPKSIQSDYATTKPHAKINKNSKAANKKSQYKSPHSNSFLAQLTPLDRQLVKTVSIGISLNFIHKNGKSIKANLSWINPKTGRYLFVNDRGLKITDKSPQQLADGLSSNRITINKKS